MTCSPPLSLVTPSPLLSIPLDVLYRILSHIQSDKDRQSVRLSCRYMRIHVPPPPPPPPPPLYYAPSSRVSLLRPTSQNSPLLSVPTDQVIKGINILPKKPPVSSITSKKDNLKDKATQSSKNYRHNRGGRSAADCYRPPTKPAPVMTRGDSYRPAVDQQEMNLKRPPQRDFEHRRRSDSWRPADREQPGQPGRRTSDSSITKGFGELGLDYSKDPSRVAHDDLDFPKQEEGEGPYGLVLEY